MKKKFKFGVLHGGRTIEIVDHADLIASVLDELRKLGYVLLYEMEEVISDGKGVQRPDQGRKPQHG